MSELELNTITVPIARSIMVMMRSGLSYFSEDTSMGMSQPHHLFTERIAPLFKIVKHVKAGTAG